ncbi:MAG: hypothetical protein HQK49_17090 [Oligoflexia bacterium]|nr:hypothetical protein [Oligoflexia bacterium]
MRKIYIFYLFVLFLPMLIIMNGCHYLDEEASVGTPPLPAPPPTTTEVETPTPVVIAPPVVVPPVITTPIPIVTPEVEVAIEPIKFHYPKTMYDFYHGIKIDEIKPTIESGKVEKFVLDKEGYFPIGLLLNPNTGAISGTPIKYATSKELKFTIWALGKNEREKEKVQLTYSFQVIKSTDIFVGNDHVCSIVKEPKDYVTIGVLCWGNLSMIGDPLIEPHFVYYSNEYLDRVEMNNNGMCVMTDAFIKCKLHKDEIFKKIMPIGENYNNITMGATHTCALENSKKIKCWGSNTFGQLGKDPSVVSFFETPIEVVINSQIDLNDISAGDNHTCYSDNDDKAYCWGDNRFGQLGITGTKIGPVLVPKLPQGKVLFVASKGNFSCAVCYEVNQVFCWGEMYFNGVKKIFSSPTEITGIGADVFALDLGLEESCAHDEDYFYCWGKYIQGVVKRSIPTGKINGKVQIGDGFYCMTISTGVDEVFCWGKNDKGQLGVESYIKESSVPIPALPWKEPIHLVLPRPTPTPIFSLPTQ